MKTTPATFDIDLETILAETEKEVLGVTDESLDSAAEFLKSKLVESTPRGNSTQHLADKWKIKKLEKKRKLSNSKNVKHKGRSVPLINILEYSTSHGHPFVEKTVQNNAETIIETFRSDLKSKL